MNKNPKFQGLPLQLELQDGKYATWKLLRSITYCRKNGDIIMVPTGFVTNLTSIPWEIPMKHHREGRWTPAAVIHDYLYRSHAYGNDRKGRQESDRVLIEMLEDLDISAFMRNIFYASVRAFGWHAWKKQ